MDFDFTDISDEDHNYVTKVCLKELFYIKRKVWKSQRTEEMNFFIFDKIFISRETSSASPALPHTIEMEFSGQKGW